MKKDPNHPRTDNGMGEGRGRRDPTSEESVNEGQGLPVKNGEARIRRGLK